MVLFFFLPLERWLQPLNNLSHLAGLSHPLCVAKFYRAFFRALCAIRCQTASQTLAATHPVASLTLASVWPTATSLTPTAASRSSTQSSNASESCVGCLHACECGRVEATVLLKKCFCSRVSHYEFQLKPAFTASFHCVLRPPLFLFPPPPPCAVAPALLVMPI